MGIQNNSESSKESLQFPVNSPGSTNMEYGEYATTYTKHICDQFGPRITCSPSEKAAAEETQKILSKICDETALDSFSCFPDLYPGGFIKMCAVCIFFGWIFFFTPAPWCFIAAITPFLGVFIMWASFFLMKEWFAFPFKRGTSQNATGRIFPRDETNKPVPGKIKIVVCGHLDSAYQMKITDYGDNIYQMALPGVAYIAAQLLLGIAKGIWGLVRPGIYFVQWGPFAISFLDVIFLIVSIIGIPLLIRLVGGLVGGKPVLGANDNLSAVGVAIALGNYFSQPEHRLKNIELWVGGFGSEECGERGAHAFVKKYGHLGLLDNAHALIPDSAGAGDRLAIITHEKVHYAHHDLEVCLRLNAGYEQYIAEDHIESPIPCKIRALPFAASDAGRFSLAGYRATAILGFDGALSKPKNWHHEEDSPQNLDLPMMTAVFGMIKHYILQLEHELSQNPDHELRLRKKTQRKTN
jgi:hypothetical protein